MGFHAVIGMNASLDIVFKGFLEKCSLEKQKSIFCFLPTSEQQKLQEIPSPSQLSSQKIFHDGILNFVHYSWFIPTLNTYSPSDISLFLVLFSPSQIQSLEAILKIAPASFPLSIFGQNFLKNLLISSLVGDKKTLLQLEYLPTSRCNDLLALSKTSWTRIIDYLGLYDLISSLSLIVETKLLKKIFNALTKEQKTFIQQKGTYREPFSFPLLPLETWDGEAKSLSILLHKRGLNRLAIAFSTQHKDLIWYLCHVLDIGRGTSIEKLCINKAPQTMSEHITEQILDLTQKSGELHA
ncbi:MAG: hypothetical protein WCP39_07780 [Chlamydiota bacterium]